MPYSWVNWEISWCQRCFVRKSRLWLSRRCSRNLFRSKPCRLITSWVISIARAVIAAIVSWVNVSREFFCVVWERRWMISMDKLRDCWYSARLFSTTVDQVITAGDGDGVGICERRRERSGDPGVWAFVFDWASLWATDEGQLKDWRCGRVADVLRSVFKAKYTKERPSVTSTG